MRHEETSRVGGRALHRYRTCFVVTALAVLGLHSPARGEKSPFDWAFVRLDYARKEKVQQLRRFCDRTHGLAGQARQDERMVKFFNANYHYDVLARQGAAPEELKREITKFRRTFDAYYIEHYLAFHDIMFVDKRGRVFYAVRKESDFLANLFDSKHFGLPLSQCLRANPQKETFIDFHYYAASDEPAAFFVEPIHIDGKHLGWLVLQCALNKVNSLFAGDEQMGETGEAFAVNRDGYMLTESNFEDDSTILKKRLDDQNVKAKFAAGNGHLTVTDYRGLPVLTSFEVFEFLDTQWLVVVKVDEAQITTEHFKQHRSYYADAFFRHMKDHPLKGSTESFSPGKRKVLRVDMDEFVRVNHDEVLRTFGISTCTGLIATYPGKFGYMAHMSSLDKAYGGYATDLVSSIVKKIKTYDIYKYERRHVRFVIVANHFVSLPNIINKLVDEGFLLSQIRMIYHPLAQRASICSYDYSKDRTVVEWLLKGDVAEKCVLHGGSGYDFDDIVRQAIR